MIAFNRLRCSRPRGGESLDAALSDLVAYGEMGFSGRMPTGKAGTEVAVLMDELRNLGWLPRLAINTSSVKTFDVKTEGVSRSEQDRVQDQVLAHPTAQSDGAVRWSF